MTATPTPADAPGQLSPGIHADVPARRYHADRLTTGPTLSRGCAHILVTQTPAHAYVSHPRLGGVAFEASKTMDRGSVIHELMLGIGGGIAVGDFKDWRTDASKDFKAAAVEDGKTPILKSAYDEAQEAVAGIRHRMGERGLADVFKRGMNEATILFDDNGTLCRTRLDNLDLEADMHRACIWDLKTCEDASLEACEKKIGSMGYSLQASFNRRGVEIARPDTVGRIEFVLVFAEVNPPYAVQPVRLSGAWREIGDHQYRRALALWSRCLKAGEWPAYVGDIPFAEPRPWDLNELTQ